MLLKVLKREFALLLAFIVAFAMLLPMNLEISFGADGVINLSNPSIKVTFSGNGTWNGSNQEINGSVTGENGGTCSSPKSKSAQLTLANDSSSEAMLSFTLEEVSPNGGTVKVDGTSVANPGYSYSKLIQPNESAKIEITSATGASTTSVKLSGIKLIKKVASVKTTFEIAEGGTYTVDSAAITQQTVYTNPSDKAYILKASPNAGYKFYQWKDAKGNVISGSASCTYQSETDETLYPVFLNEEQAVFGVGNKTFLDMDEAVNYAKSQENKVVFLVSDGTISSGTYRIPKGVTLLIPYDSSNTLSTDKPVYKSAYSQPKEYRRLSLASGAAIIVEDGGSISVGSEMNAMAGGAYYAPTGPSGYYGHIKLDQDCKIELEKGANLYAWGYVTGSGTVDARSGSNVYEMLQLRDFRGGSATSGINNSSVFPFVSYTVQNIESRLNIYAGATENVFTGVKTGLGYHVASAKFLSFQDGLFTVKNGYMSKVYNPEDNRLYLESHGETALDKITINIGTSVKTGEKVLPFTSGMSIDIVDGSFSINNDVELLPDVELNIHEGASLTVGSEASLYVFDGNEWNGKNYGLTAGINRYPVIYSPSWPTNQISAKSAGIKSPLPDAKLDVNGHVHVNGHLYTTNGTTGTDVNGELTGVRSTGSADIVSSQGSGTVQWNIKPNVVGKLLQTVLTSAEYNRIGIESATLHNGNAYADTDKEYTKTDSVPSGGRYEYNQDKDRWMREKPEAPSATIDYKKEKLSGLAKNGKYTINGVEHNADANGQIDIDESWIGTEIELIACGDEVDVNDSKPASIAIPARPEAPSLNATKTKTETSQDARILGLYSSKNYSYKRAEDEGWLAAKAGATSIDNLGVGTYLVKTEATDNAFVSEIVSIEIKARQVASIAANLAKTEYIEGQELDLEGAKLEVTYDDESVDSVELTADMISGFDSTKLGNQNLRVEAFGKTTTVRVSVREKSLTEIKVTKSPDKMTYVSGEKFDPTGMVVTAYYDNGTSSEIQGYETNPSATVELKHSDTDVKISYQGKEIVLTGLQVELRDNKLEISNAKDKVYDGKAFETEQIKVDTQSKGEVTFHFYRDESCEDMLNDAPKNAGVYFLCAEQAAAGEYKSGISNVLMIEITKADFTVNAINYNKPYDGKDHNGGGEASVPEGTSYKYKVDGSEEWKNEAPIIKDAGEVKYTVKATNPNYKDATAEGTLKVTPKSVTMTSEGKEKSYDGQPLTNNNVNDEGFEAGEGAEYKVTGTITDAGSTDNTFTYTLINGAKKENYDIKQVYGRLVVKQAKAPEIDVKGYTGTYDGKEHHGEARVEVSGSKIEYKWEGQDWTTDKPSIKDVGTLEFEVRSTNPNYKDATAKGTLKVTPKSVTMTSEGKEKAYDGQPLTNNKVNDEGFEAGEGAEYKVTGTITDAGSTDNTFTYTLINGAKKENYNIKQVYGRLVVKQAKAPEIGVKGYTGTYDGEEHHGEARVEVSGSKIEYKWEGQEWTTDKPSIKDVGTLEFEVRSTNPNYETATGKGTLTVTPKAVTVTVDSKIKVFGEEDPDFTAQVKGNLNNDKIVYDLARTKGEDVDEYAITATGKEDQGNYRVTFVSGKLTITKKEKGLNIVAKTESRPYNGEALVGNVKIEVVNPDMSKTSVSVDDKYVTVKYSTDNGVTWNSKAPKLIDVGEQTYSVKVSHKNYKDATAEGTLKVTPKSVTMTSEGKEKSYDGQPLTNNNVNDEGFEAGEGAEYKVTGTITDAGSTDNTFEYTLINGAKEKNYNIKQVYGKLVVKPKTIEIIWTGTENRSYGDGIAVQARVYEKQIVGDDQVEVEVEGGEASGAGDYIAKARLAGRDAKNYTIKSELQEIGYTIGQSEEAMPEPSIQYSDETIEGLEANCEYLIDDRTYTSNSEGAIQISKDWFGSSVSVIRKGDGVNTIDSDGFELAIPEIPEAPKVKSSKTTTVEAEDGSILGLDKEREYSYHKEGSNEWISVPAGSTAIENLGGGVYFVRVSATVDSFASKAREITVSARNPVSLEAYLAKDVYIEGQELVLDGGTITITYDDKTTSTHPLTEDMITTAYDKDKIGEQTLKVIAEGVETTIVVSVQKKKLTNILIEENPEKMEYVSGETFDTKGMVVTAYYDNGTQAQVKNYTLKPSKETELTHEIETITVSYQEDHITCEAVLEGISVDRKEGELVISAALDKVYDGQAVSLDKVDAKTDSAGEIHYAFYSDVDCNHKLESAPKNAGTYYLRAVQDEEGEYKEIKSNTLAFAINKAALTVTAKPASIIYGQSPANEGVTYEGFVQGDNEAVLSGNVEYSYNYNRLDDVGSYEISLEESTLESNNYEISYEKGALIVEPKQVELEWHNVDNRIEKDKKSVSATVNGIEDGDNVTAKVSGGKAQKPGSYVATAELTGGKAGNYRLADNAVNYKLKTRKMAGVLLATVAMKGKSTAVLTWTPVEDAEYYEVYMSLCNYKKTVGKWKKVKTVKAGKKLIWKKSGLKHGRNYKFKVIAIKGKQTLKSPTLHSIVGNVHGKRTNAGSIKALNKTINLKVGGTAKAKAKLKGVKKNHGILAKWHIEKIRYISDNTSVATVTDKGVIKGRNKGTCKVYLIAPNGLYSTIKVRVK